MIILNVFLLTTVLVFVKSANPVVEISHGFVEGTWRKSTNNREYASFRSIPFASPPTGEYRFKDPQPLRPWSGIWNASDYGQPCLQYNLLREEVIGIEDCLYLNVYTPRLENHTLLPVVAYIHGGGFLFGSSYIYNPVHIMDWDMVIVTMNYRVGPLGFLNIGDDEAPGNAGLKDQSYALRWIKDNIKSFGGNPEEVTLVGQSAGAASVHHHYLSPMSKGTFARGITYSGTALNAWAFQKRPFEVAKRLAAKLKCSINNSSMIQCLKNKTGIELVTASYEMLESKLSFPPFHPSTESSAVSNPFLTKDPHSALLEGNTARLPLIVSVTSQDGVASTAGSQISPPFLDELDNKWSSLAGLMFSKDIPPLSIQSVIANKTRQFYFQDKKIGKETVSELVEALTDIYYRVPASKLAHMNADLGLPVYFLEYAFRSTESTSNVYSHSTNFTGASHGDDLYHIFKVPYLNFDSPDDIKMRNILIDVIYSFATTGKPKLPGVDTWDPVRPGSSELNYLRISSPSKIEEKLSSDFGHVNFWDSLGL